MLHILKTQRYRINLKLKSYMFTEMRTFPVFKQTSGGFAEVRQHFKYLGGCN